MPKHYISSENIEDSLYKVANNLVDNFNLKDWEVSTYVSRIFKGIIDDKTIAGYFPAQYKKPYGVLSKCGVCGKGRLKSLKRHMNISHPNI